MNVKKKINIYVFNCGKQLDTKSSDMRIRHCAGLFIKSDERANLRHFLLNDEIPAVKRAEGQKPRFETDIGLRFSVSHSGIYWICAFSEQEIGIDIQNQTNNYRREISKRFFHPDEHEYLIKTDYKNFYCIWTAKESYVKYTGQGIDKNFSAFSVVAGDKIPKKVNNTSIKFLPLDPDYCLCLCAAEIEGVNMQIISDKNDRMTAYKEQV